MASTNYIELVDLLRKEGKMKNYSKLLFFITLLLATYGSYRLGQDAFTRCFHNKGAEETPRETDAEVQKMNEIPRTENSIDSELESEIATPTPEVPVSSMHYVGSIDEFSNGDYESIKENITSVMRIVLAEENVWEIMSGNPRFSTGYFYSAKSSMSNDFKNRLLLYFEVPYQGYEQGSAIVAISFENIKEMNDQIQITYSDRTSTVYNTPYWYHNYTDYDEIYKDEVLLLMDNYSIAAVPYDFGELNLSEMDPLQSYSE